ncbi:MAG: GvpL/GvpF family gas vesicle protein [Trichodesmium sp. ALOHA_ZT_67]|nr:GvpL/GvpF family gas vesicle protein [Trichodesmium sp. ALOHA_ZT_67]MDE5096450.1 GvpL/GvpF family gas vesicle protein [Trichodesmium sp. St11_bin5]MDT9339276.1 GvpL/GvpF family gas vesicle protein [Trichodesmium erythraeum 21-75]
MSYYVYGFLYLPESCLALPKGMEKEVELVPYQNIAAVVEANVSIEAIQETEEKLLDAILAHDRVVREIFQQVSMLPLRFGNAFALRENIINDLQNNQQQYLNILTKLQQQAEYTITFTPVSYPSTLEVSKVRGKAYLLAKKQQFEQQQAFQTKQRQQWENIRQLIFKNYPKAVFRDSTESKIKQVHLLANRDARVITTEELSTWQTECSYWQITLSEQLPPYHFV